MKKKLQTLTKRSRSMAVTERIAQLNSYIGGWMGYSALADAETLLQGFDEWLRREYGRFSGTIGSGRAHARRGLRRLGMKEQTASEIAGTRKGYWRTAATPQLHKALSLA